ncbi:MAG: glycosyltransferase [Thermoplasmata archaeon]
MSVVLINGSAPRDGLTNLFLCHLEGLRAIGGNVSTVTFIDPGLPDQYPYTGERIHGRRFPGSARATMALNRMIPVYARKAARLPGLIHANDVYLARAVHYKHPVVVTIADLGKVLTSYYPRPYSWVHNFHVRYVQDCDAVIVPSEYVRADVITALSLAPETVHTVPLFPLLPPRPRPESLPSRPTPQQPWTIGFVAVDRPHKNIGRFLDILRRLDDRYRGLLVSRLTPAHQRHAEPLLRKGKLSVIQWSESLAPVYASMQILLFPSLFEGFGLPVVEAMSQGVPVVVTSRTSLPELVGEGGLRVDPDSSLGWIEAVERLSDPAEQLRWAQRAWDRAMVFSRERTGRALRFVYEKVSPGSLETT